MISSIFVPIHREGYKMVAIFAVISLLFYMLSTTLGYIGFILTVWCVYFFRDPYRVTPQGESLIVSPADGVVQMITEVGAPKGVGMKEGKYKRVSIFLSVFNVHVNRLPIKGKIHHIHYHPGKFLNASLDKASDENERQITVVKTEDGTDIAVVQIAGLIARRIVCEVRKDQEVVSGERLGVIRFGSRVDVYLPEGIEPKVLVGQTVLGGESIIADLKGTQTKIEGVRH